MKCFSIFILLALPSAAVQTAEAKDYFDVLTATCDRRSGKSRFVASVDVPVAGPEDVVRNVKRWICDVLEVDVPKNVDAADFGMLIKQSSSAFLSDAEGGSRKVEITWTYEDPTCVTFESKVSDRDSVEWTTADVATFSKAGGRRVEASDVFACDENKIKELMWQYRGSTAIDVTSPSRLYVGNVGFIDGWVVVIGPAENSGGAEYRIRYQAAEPFLRPTTIGYCF